MDEKTRRTVIIVVEIVGFIAACIGICTFFTGWQSIFQIFNGIQLFSARDCSLTTQIGPWSASEVITLNADRDGWVQVDFWSPIGEIIADYDEVSIILEPHLQMTVSNVSGIAWKYDRSWTKDDVERCTQRHIQDSWDIRQKRLILVTPKEFCTIVDCY